MHTLTKCRCESDVFGRAVSESDMLNANAVSRTRRMSLRIKRDRKSYVRGAHESWRSPADLRDSRLLNLSCGFSRSFRGLAFVFIRRTRHGRSVPRTSPRSMATLGEGRRICTRRLHVTRSSLTMETRGFFAIAHAQGARILLVACRSRAEGNCMLRLVQSSPSSTATAAPCPQCGEPMDIKLVEPHPTVSKKEKQL